MDNELSSDSPYVLERSFWFVWRWRLANRYGGRTGLALGAAAARRQARTVIRGRKLSSEIQV